MTTMGPDTAWQTWQAFGARQTWATVLERAQTEHDRQVAQRSLDELPAVSALDALAANAALVEILTAQRWHVMQAAREAGATWTELGQALNTTRQGAYDYYRRRVTEQEQYVPDVHDADRARAALGGTQPDWPR
jgi:hypothetical protein